jgi:HTH-type transcriptional regulator, quorum sensing regulator NprR
MAGESLIEMGPFIKLQRTKRNMTQEELAEGIVSLSYLSKIENQKTKASPQIIQLLCDRLGIELMDKADSQIEEKCKEWYDLLFDRYDKQLITANYEELQQMMDRSINNHLIMFEIHKIRYYVVLRDFEKASNKINELYGMVDSFNHTQSYYWYKFKGNHYSLKEDHQQAMRCYKTAEEKIRLANIDEAEIANLHYTLSVTHSKLWEELEAIDYAKQAMAVFQRNYDFISCALCHILLGISYQRIKMLKRAMKNYNLAKHLGELNSNEEVVQLVDLNIGYLYRITGNSEAAIKNYLIAAKSKKIDYNHRLAAIINLIQEYFTIREYAKVREYLRQAENILELAKNKYYNKLYDYSIQVYKYLLNGDVNKFKSILTDDFLPYLKQQGDYGNLVIYAKLLAAQLEEMGKYKESVQYYKLVSNSYNKLINL